MLFAEVMEGTTHPLIKLWCCVSWHRASSYPWHLWIHYSVHIKATAFHGCSSQWISMVRLTELGYVCSMQESCKWKYFFPLGLPMDLERNFMELPYKVRWLNIFSFVFSFLHASLSAGLSWLTLSPHSSIFQKQFSQ